VKITKQRLKQIIVEEVTNRLLAEKSTVLDPSEYGAVMEKFAGEFRIHVYKINKDNENDQIEVIGTITVGKTKKPCIPRTYEVNSVAVKEGYQNRGIGLDLYRFAMGILDKQGYGITSDHSSGTKEKATDFWVRMGSDADKNAGLAYKRQTDAGNDTFDYDGSTPDPDDDCDKVALGGDNATDHSFRINPSEAGPARSQLMKLMMNHINVKRAFENGGIRVAKLDNLDPNSYFARTTPNRGEQLEQYIAREAARVFIEEYGKAV
jgi:GNAT superfamily N-acetyltransferase